MRSLLPLLLLPLLGAARGEDMLTLHKCCPMGQRLTAEATACEALPPPPNALRSEHRRIKVTVLWETLLARETLSEGDTPDQHYFWVPPALRSRELRVFYGKGPLLGSPLAVAADATEDNVKRFLAIDNERRLFQLRPFRRRVHGLAVRRQRFCLDASADPARPRLVLTEVELRPLPKCCGRRQRVNKALTDCEDLPSALPRTPLQPTLQPTLRPTLQTTLQPTLEPTLQTTLQPALQEELQSTLQPTLEPTLQTTLQPPLEEELQTTLQTTLEPTLQTTPQPKFDPLLQPTFQPALQPPLQPIAQALQQPLQYTEVVDPAEEPNITSWLPTFLHKSKILVKYNALSKDKWFIPTDADDDIRWRILPLKRDLTVWICDMNSPNPLGTRPEGTTVDFCLDETADGQFKHVVLSRVLFAHKCCAKGEQLNAEASACEARPGFEADALDSEVLDPTRNASAAYWLPTQLRGHRIPVGYGYNFTKKHRAFPAEDTYRWQIEFSHSHVSNVLSLVKPAPSGSEVRFRMPDFCFDAVSGGPLAPRAILAVPPDVIGLVGTKCCSATQIFSPEGRCRDVDHSLLSSMGADAVRMLTGGDARESAVRYGVPNAFCDNNTYHMEASTSASVFSDRVVESREVEVFYTKYYCADFRQGADGALEQVFAFCVSPPSAPLYEKVRPLHVLAALLLAAAVAAIFAQERTRATTHGRALACHGACLMASNVLQAAWFFTHRREKSCDLFAYAIYFFLMGAAFWLNVISINMARGFRRPQRALKAGLGGTGGSRGWRRFACFSAYAWGVTAALTAFTVTMHRWQDDVRRHHLSPPTFIETRTCNVEYVYSSTDVYGKPKESEDELGAIYYYYAPCVFLVLCNALCLGYTLFKIRALRRDSSMARKTPAAVRTMLLYVKLLLTAGVVELVLEGTAWGARQRRFQGRFLLAKDHAREIAFVFAVANTFLDLARAAAVLWLCVERCRPSKASRGAKKHHAKALEAKSGITRTDRGAPTATAALSTRETRLFSLGESTRL